MDLSSDESDLDLLSQISDWDGEECDEEVGLNASRTFKMDYTQCLNDAEFTFRFRLPKAVVEELLKEIMPFVRATSTRYNEVPPLHQLLLTLRFFALGTMLKSLVDFVGISTSFGYRIVRDVSMSISRLYRHYVVVHLEHENKFHRIAGFPRVFGVIDCTHVHIPQSQLVGEEFRNCHGYFSINVQVVCDANLKFMNIESHWPGSTHDATIFSKSHLKAKCDAGLFNNNWLLGDTAYPNRTYLLTPLLNPKTESEQRYNAAHAKTWITIERTLEAWKRRFPIISLTMRLSLSNASAVIIATAVLHNISRNNNLDDIPPEVELPIERVDHSALPNHGEESAQDYRQRDDLILNVFSD